MTRLFSGSGDNSVKVAPWKPRLLYTARTEVALYFKWAAFIVHQWKLKMRSGFMCRRNGGCPSPDDEPGGGGIRIRCGTERIDRVRSKRHPALDSLKEAYSRLFTSNANKLYEKKKSRFG